eukprot:972516-Amphidinium_carterae.3
MSVQLLLTGFELGDQTQTSSASLEKWRREGVCAFGKGNKTDYMIRELGATKRQEGIEGCCAASHCSPSNKERCVHDAMLWHLKLYAKSCNAFFVQVLVKEVVVDSAIVDIVYPNSQRAACCEHRDLKAWQVGHWSLRLVVRLSARLFLQGC